jgi:hypothetical protein
MPIMNDVINALQRCVANRQGPLFQTYLDFHQRYSFPGLANSWANRKVLDPAARWFKANNLLDLTFLLHRKDTGYPSVIDGLDSRKPTPKQKPEQARGSKNNQPISPWNYKPLLAAADATSCSLLKIATERAGDRD